MRSSCTRLKLQNLRHLHAATLLADGVPVLVVAARLGHASSKMILDVYGHAIPAQDGAAADAITKARIRPKGQRSGRRPA